MNTDPITISLILTLVLFLMFTPLAILMRPRERWEMSLSKYIVLLIIPPFFVSMGLIHRVFIQG